MQNMQNISHLFSRRKTKKLHKISESESSINSRTCLGHLVFFFFCLAPKQKNAAPCIPGAQHTSILALATRFWATSPPLHAFHQIAHWLAPSQVNHNDDKGKDLMNDDKIYFVAFCLLMEGVPSLSESSTYVVVGSAYKPQENAISRFLFVVFNF